MPRKTNEALVLHELGASGEPMTSAEIAILTGLTPAQVSKKLTELVAGKRVSRVRKNRSTVTFLYFLAVK